MSSTTIAALATAPAPAGVAVVRMSGSETKRALRAIFKSKESPLDAPRKLIYGDFIDHRDGSPIDRGMAVFMPGPHSFTGEDVAELHLHGSPLLVAKLLRSLFAFGIVPAEPGEFSKRGFLHGKMDLTQAEAICDLIEATSERALEIAGEQLTGKLSKTTQELGEPLRDSLAELEAQIDFPEEDISPDSLATIRENILQLQKTISELLGTYAFGSHVKEGYKVLLCGATNVGKSSLLNTLLEKKRAIVTDISGTTRDIIEDEALYDGYKFIFCDSAGIRKTEDKVEQIGIELARERIPWADLVLLIVDADDKDKKWEESLEIIQKEAKQIWMVVNKIDLHPEAIGKIFCEADVCRQNFYISAQQGDGIKQLKTALLDEIKKSKSNAGEHSTILTRERHRNCFLRAHKALETTLSAIASQHPLEVISAELRIGLSALDELIGKTHTEDILGRIFSKFCIGK